MRASALIPCPFLLTSLVLGGCSSPAEETEATAPGPPPSLAVGGPPAQSGPIVLRVRGETFVIDWVPGGTLAAFHFDIDHPPLIPGLTYDDGCGDPTTLGNTTDYQFIGSRSGQWHLNYRQLGADVAVYDITGIADPFSVVLTCAFLMDHSRLLARGQIHSTSHDNDVILSGPGIDSYGYRYQGQITTVTGEKTMFHEVATLHVTKDGTFGEFVNFKISLTPDPRF